MNIEKEVQLFHAVVATNLARIAERMKRRHPKASADDQVKHVAVCLTEAFRQRDTFDPSKEAWITWFGRYLEAAIVCDSTVDVAQLEIAITPPQARRFFDGSAVTGNVYHQPNTSLRTVAGTFGYVRRDPDFGEAGTPLNLNALPRGAQDCPPCWRCRYFDGWLPADEDEVEASSAAALDPEIAESCLRIDRNKVRVANWVRGMGWANLEDDPE